MADCDPAERQLLLPPPSEATSQYFQQVTQRVSDDVEVRLDAGDGKGKGIFALKDFDQDEVVFREPPLAGAQHTANRQHALVCSQCFRYIGSVELQIARRLLPASSTGGGASARSETGPSSQHCGAHSAAAHSHGAASHSHSHGTASHSPGAGAGSNAGPSDHSHAATASQTEAGASHSLDTETARLVTWLEPLLDGSVQLPHSSAFPMPAVVPCPGGCAQDSYCSAACAQAAWSGHHQLLCTGSPPGEQGEAPGASRHSAPSGGDGASKRSRTDCGPPRVSAASGQDSDTVAVETRSAVAAQGVSAAGDAAAGLSPGRRVALDAFKTHADATNDIFHVAARVVAGVLLRAREILGNGAEPAYPKPSATPSGTDPSPEVCWKALQASWLPHACAWNAVWWEAVALPSDVRNEAAFRAELRGLAAESLELLCAALYDERFPALFELPVYGSIIGMFELNNLGIVVASPVEDYFLLIDGLEEPDRAACQAVTGPLLDALDEAYDIPAEGTGFYALQSCANHSCEPNAHTLKGEEDADGAAVVTARRPIRKGEEITISYIDEEAPLEERREALRDYGFVCRCARCVAGA